jgi:branched-chain amino acid transport system permease protein
MTRSLLAGAALLAVTVAALLGAGSFSPYYSDVGVTLLTYVTVAQAWNVLGGFAGQISLGTAALVGIGGYASGLFLVHTGVDWPLAVLLAGGLGAASAVLLSVPLLRLRGDYFAVGTLAATIALDASVRNWSWAGGSIGFTMPIDRIPTGPALFRLAVIVAAVALAVTLYVSRSDFGLRLTAIRDDEPAAAGLGVSVYLHRLTALVASSVLASCAGAVAGFQTIAVTPDGMFSLLSWSLNALLMSVVGGAGTFLGPIVGVLIVYYGLITALEGTQTLSLFLEGILLVAIVRFAPMGVWPLVQRVGRAAIARRRAPRPGAQQPAREDPSPLEMEIM